ncbi:MAG: hypothetical protein PHY47_25770 [Lachnospiraceae bacterium]|nr:hypothetical protein [Lachnospiraceae bacterium]
MINKDCKGTSNLLNFLNRVKVMAIFILVVVTLTSCSQKSSIEENATEVTSENDSNRSEENGMKISKDNVEKIEISMEEAISIGMEEATKYYDNLQLTEVHSYDNDRHIDKLSGDDGKRQWWYVNFANEKLNYVSVLISDGKIDVVEHFDNNGNNELIDLADVNLTSEEAVQRAQEMGLIGGNPNNQEDWVSGYNFKMSYASLVDSPDDVRIFLEVIGISPNGNFAHIDFDAVTGEVILAEEKIEYKSREAEWKVFE